MLLLIMSALIGLLENVVFYFRGENITRVSIKDARKIPY